MGRERMSIMWGQVRVWDLSLHKFAHDRRVGWMHVAIPRYKLTSAVHAVSLSKRIARHTVR